MAIEIQETFQVRAPIAEVWRFVMDPQQVVACMPGAALDSVVDERTFMGNVKIKVGAITTTYKGRVQFTEIDEPSYVMRMVAEGRETGGGIAKGNLSSRLRPLPDGQTEVVAEASVDLTGRIVQVGRGMIQGVAHQLFQQFAASVKARLEVAQAGAAQSTSPPAAAEAKPIRIVPIVLHVIWSAIAGFFRRLFGGSAS
ncbi:MAG: SRPBCC family protein [Deltaproteobacteria bacterium]|nr:SRPBCC family protein [Deltaproteobacteria bacterium]